MKVDPYRAKERYISWKERMEEEGIPGLTRANSEIIGRYLHDMELGVNIGKGTKRGGRSYHRLNALRSKLSSLARKFQRKYDVNLEDVTAEQAHGLFAAMRTGEIEKHGGGAYKSTGDYVKVFRAFWNWHMKAERKKGRTVRDVVCDLDDSTPKPSWVYVTEEDLKLLCRHAKYKYRVLMMFLYDSGIRSPTELVNVRVRDLSKECDKLTIRDETSKTYGRTITLLLSSEMLREYIEAEELGPFDQVFPIDPSIVNRYFRRLGKRILGEEQSPAGKKYSDLTLYDFRHSSACYWLPRYKTESALKYRFGWKKSEMIEYYTGFLGMRDTITEDDLLIDTERTEVEQELARTKKEKALLEEKLQAMDGQMKEILQVVSGLTEKAA